MPGRKLALWFAAALTVLSISSATATADERACNGAPELCERPLEQVVLPGTHNSMSSAEYDWALPNQLYSIPTQLEMGIRAFLIDTHYGKPFQGGPRIENSNRAQSTGMFLCHEYCLLGSTPLISELATVRDFLAANPNEVLVVVNQAGVTPDDFAQAVTDSGLLSYVYTGSTAAYPTLAQMIDSNQRVVMLSEGNTGSVPWYHAAYDGPLQETPYNFRADEQGNPLSVSQGMNLLTDPATLNSTCRPNRGGETGPLFLMNHWVNGLLDGSNPVEPDPEVSRVLNRREVLVNRARACESRRGKVPNIIAVDLFGEGDLLTAVKELNGLTRPDLRLRHPGARKVRAGRAAVYSLVISNRGDADATNARVCAKVPKRFAIKPACRNLAIKQGAKKTIRFKVRTRRARKGTGHVRFTVTTAGAVSDVSARLTVKAPKKAKKKKRRAKGKRR